MKSIGSYRSALILVMVLFTGVALGGCKMAQMALPQNLKSETSELAVEGLRLSFIKKSLHFGPYQVTDIHRGWTKGKGWSITSGSTKISDSKAEQKYEFSMSEPGSPAWEVQCATGAEWSKAGFKGLFGGRSGIEFGTEKQLVCNLKQVGVEAPSRLAMAQSRHEMEMNGVMRAGATEVDISVSYKLAGTPLKMGDPTGYVFSIEGQPVGAVEIINKGTVYLDNSVKPETRSALAAASAVLLLYQDVKK